MAEDKNNHTAEDAKNIEEKAVSVETAPAKAIETSKISVSVETVEKEADKILDEARIKSNDILLKAREEVNRIANSSLVLAEVEVEKEKIIKAARDDARKKLQASKTESSRIKTAIGNKEDNIVKQLIQMVTGAEAK